MKRIITITRPSGTMHIILESGIFSVSGGTVGERYRMQRQLHDWWKHGIVAMLPGEGDSKAITIEQQTIQSDHPRFVDVVVRTLQLHYGYDAVVLEGGLTEEARIDQRLAIALRGMEQLETLREATAEVRKVLPRLTFERKKELADMLCV